MNDKLKEAVEIFDNVLTEWISGGDISIDAYKEARTFIDSVKHHLNAEGCEGCDSENGTAGCIDCNLNLNYRNHYRNEAKDRQSIQEPQAPTGKEG